ncbi:MAG: hypothetical protein WAZ40_03745 [Minisyncoccia bacterium]
MSTTITKRGASLLELLIYVALLSGRRVIVTDAFVSLSKGRGQTEARSEVNAGLRFATEKIRQDIKGASVLVTPVLGTASSTLNLTVAGTTILYNVSGGQLWRKEGVASPVLVSGTNIIVDAPLFTRLENYNTYSTSSILSATTTAVQMQMSMHYNASTSDWMYADTLRTTILLR